MAEPEIKMPAFSLKPRYRLTKPLYVNDDGLYIAEDEIIEYDGTPNEFMQPENEAAVKKLTEWYQSKGGITPDLGEIKQRAYENRPREPIPDIKVVSGGLAKPALMGDMKPDGSKKIGETPSTVKHIPKADKPKYIRPLSATANPAEEIPHPGSI